MPLQQWFESVSTYYTKLQYGKSFLVTNLIFSVLMVLFKIFKFIIMSFLMGLINSFSHIRSHILLFDLLWSIGKVSPLSFKKRCNVKLLIILSLSILMIPLFFQFVLKGFWLILKLKISRNLDLTVATFFYVDI